MEHGGGAETSEPRSKCLRHLGNGEHRAR
jgi:hypothetical protein